MGPSPFPLEKITSRLVELYYRRYNCLKSDIRFFNLEIIACIYSDRHDDTQVLCGPCIFFLKLQFHKNNSLNCAFDDLQLVFTHQKCIARLGLMHLCCTNLAVWFRCIILETLDVLSGYHHRGSGKTGPENVTEIPLIKSSAASRKLLGSKYYNQMLKQLLFTKFFSTIQITYVVTICI